MSSFFCFNAKASQQQTETCKSVIDFNFPIQKADVALTNFSEKANISVIYRYDLVKNVMANSLVGEYTCNEAIKVLLKGTSLEGNFERQHLLILEKKNTRHSKMNTKKSILATLFASLLSSNSVAQQEDGDNTSQTATDSTEVIQVSGIRSSLMSSLNSKRNSDSMQDSIVAEDLGKFPDSNVAESLQRIPGVTIDRSGGEGQKITVRGFGPDFNTVLLNGRRIASTSNASIGGAIGTDQRGQSLSSRGFNFDILAAELIGGADVYKSSKASFQEGGVGSTVDLRTLRPLSLKDGFSGALSAKATYEDLAGTTSPNLFAFGATQILDGKLGLLGSVSYQKREALREFATTAGGYIRQTVSEGDTTGFANAVGNIPGTYYYPRNLDLLSSEQDRERFGATFTAEYKANEDVSFVLDVLHSEFTNHDSSSRVGGFFVPNNSTGVVFDDNNTVTQFDNENRVIAYVAEGMERPTSLTAIGANLNWIISPTLSSSIDLSYSQGRDRSAEDGGKGYFMVLREAGTLLYDNTQGNVPGLGSSVGFGEDLNNISSHVTRRDGVNLTNELAELKLDFEWLVDFGALDSIAFGVNYSSESRDSAPYQSANTSFNNGDRVPIPAEFLTASNQTDFLGGYSQLPNTFVSYDPNQVINYYESTEGLTARDINLGLEAGSSASAIPATGFDAVLNQAQVFDVTEDIFAAYVQAIFYGELNDKDWNIIAGLRYVDTTTESNSFETSLIDLLPIENDPTAYNGVLTDDLVAVRSGGDYTKLLPSINARYEVFEDVVLRAAYSQTITRPPLEYLTATTNFGNLFRPDSLVASAGNVNLQPFESENLDLSLEWYYGEASFLTAALFSKNVDGFIVTKVSQADYEIVNSQNISDNPSINGNQVTFSVTRPENSEELLVKGLELGFQHTFDLLPEPFNGLGISANATFVNSDKEFDTSNNEQSFALEGLGDSRNLVVFYENSGLELRLAYSVRDRFLLSASSGASGEPVFTEDYTQLDFRGSYQLTEFVQVFVEGTNLTGEEIQQTGRFSNHFLYLEDSGARYSLGVRASF